MSSHSTLLHWIWFHKIIYSPPGFSIFHNFSMAEQIHSALLELFISVNMTHDHWHKVLTGLWEEQHVSSKPKHKSFKALFSGCFMYFFEISGEIIYNPLFWRHFLLLKIDPVCTGMANPADDKCTNPMDDKSTNPNVSRQTINPELVRTRYVGSPIGHRPFLLHCITISLSFPFLHLSIRKRVDSETNPIFRCWIIQSSIPGCVRFLIKIRKTNFYICSSHLEGLPPISWFLLFHSRWKLMFKPLLGHSPLIMPRFHVGFHKTRFHKIAANLPL